MLQATFCVIHMWALGSSPSNLYASWMQVRRHLKGERNIPHLSDQVQVWKQEYKVLLRKTQQLMQQSEDIMIAAQT